VSRSHHFHTSATVPVPRARVFPFFADASNLERITPPELRFRIISLPSEMGEGSLIRYSLGLYGVRFEWLTRISAWNPPVEFSDEQLQGPYRRWVHRHRFEEQGENTIIHDDVEYALPLFPFGEIAAPLVRAQVRRIFAFRARAIAQALR
jgi:ligand-binding SRPBCC domain-containing protein